ncbi:MAG TPA: M3 family metallopeptidase, partial [Anaerolineaceae bacterium]|nr:M3 family metallopeptidase [Anaerolineaceae bacterium]
MTENTQTLPHWDLSNVYPGLDSAQLRADFERFQTMVDGLEKSVEADLVRLDPQAEAGTLAKALSAFVVDLNETLLLSNTMRAYIHAFVTTNTADPEAQRTSSEFEQAAVRLQTLITRVQSWIGRLGERLPAVLEIPGAAKDHAFFVREIAEQSRYLMSEAEESLAAELNLSGARAWSRLQQAVTSQQTAEIELDGKKQTLPITAVINLRSHPDEAVRRAGYEIENRVWDSVRTPLAATLNGVKGSVIVLDRRRGRRDALHAALDDARIDRETLEAMQAAIRDSFSAFRKYFLAKAARLGKEKLAWWDLFAPLGRTESTFSFEDARDYVLEHFNSFSPDLADFARQAFDRNWIDAEQRKGKVAGAFCMSVPRVKESRVLTNFDGSLDQVFTIAHELGHGYHNHCQFRAGKTELQ